MTVRGAAVALFGHLLTRNRWPFLVTAYMLLVLTASAGKSRVGNPAGELAVRSIGTAIIVPAVSR